MGIGVGTREFGHARETETSLNLMPKTEVLPVPLVKTLKVLRHLYKKRINVWTV